MSLQTVLLNRLPVTGTIVIATGGMWRLTEEKNVEKAFFLRISCISLASHTSGEFGHPVLLQFGAVLAVKEERS
jgi:hypothetical protein